MIQNIDALRARVAELDLMLAARSADVTRVETELAAFKIRYATRSACCTRSSTSSS